MSANPCSGAPQLFLNLRFFADQLHATLVHTLKISTLTEGPYSVGSNATDRGCLIEEGPRPRILSLVKFISSQWAASFRAGILRLGSVAGFRQQYELDPGRRQDPKENLAENYQPDQVILTINGIELEGLAGAIQIRREIDEISYLLCMTAITDRNLNAANGSLQLDCRLGELGDKAVIIRDVAEFQRRIQAAIDKRGDLGSHEMQSGRGSGLVEYVDLEIYHGHVGPFRKSLDFSFQCEWRLALLDRHERKAEAIYLDVGNLSDITFMVDSSSFLTNKIIVQPISNAIPVHQPRSSE